MSDTSLALRPRRGHRGVLVLQVALVLGFLGIFVYAFQSTVLAPRSVVPKSVGELKLVSKVEGEAALAQVDRLHGTGIPLADAFVATYARDGNRLQAWAGLAQDEAAAAELMRQMVEGIEKGRSPFSNLRPATVSGQPIYQVNGPGGEHFFYVSGHAVIWLIVEAGDAQAILPTAIEAFARDDGWTSAPRGY